jgi:hypothetical protein
MPATSTSTSQARHAPMRPFFPIIYVRGYAMTQGEIAATVATPYMGFNLGATKIRQDWEGRPLRHVFESPLIRLMKDYGYRDIYSHGAEISGQIPERSVIIHRYYEQADVELGIGEAPTIVQAATGLRELIHGVRRQVCGDDPARLDEFRVYLVAHSMGGLVCRCFLQNDEVSTPADRALVDKVFTYATPHNGIEMGGMNVPQFLGLWDMNNFSRPRMAEYLGLPAAERVDSLDGKFDPLRFFCLVGTNHRDYDAALGMSSRLAGEMSDGLVKIENATVQGAPRAFVHRSHSGPYGIVNSEEGYQNLVRFLFGDVRAEGMLEVEALPLPPSVRKAHEKGGKVRASYYFEATVSPRGAATYKLSERRKETFSAVLRRFDEMLMPERAELARPRWPVLFSVYLDRARITMGAQLVFSIELGVSTTGYTIDGRLFLDEHIPGEYLFRDTLTIRAGRGEDGWSVRFNRTDEAWGENAGRNAERDASGWSIPLSSKKGFKGTLRLRLTNWNGAAA